MNKGPQFDRERHGSLYDRGHSDAYYHRSPDPHWYPEGSYNGPRICLNLTEEEIEEYLAGFKECDHFKDWGDGY